MKKYFLSLTLLFTANANSYEFRGIDLYDNCSNIVSYENNLNSKVIEIDKGIGNYFFENQVFGKTAKIKYHCGNYGQFDNKLTGGDYEFSFNDYDEAKPFFEQLLKEYTLLYGSPVLYRSENETTSPESHSANWKKFIQTEQWYQAKTTASLRLVTLGTGKTFVVVKFIIRKL